MARFVGPLLVGLVLGALGGFVVGSALVGGRATGDAYRGIAPTPLHPNETSASEATISPVAIQPIAVERETSDLTESSDAPAAVVAGAVELARRAPPARRWTGSKSIRGTVTDPDGRPVVDVIVRARREPDDKAPAQSRIGEAAPPHEKLEDAVRTTVESYYRRQSDHRETATDIDGRYEFRDLREGEWTLIAWREGYDVESSGSASVRPDATLDLFATPVARVEIAVFLPDGTPAPRAAIEVKRPGEKEAGRTETWRRSESALGLTGGEWELRATLGDPEQGPSWPDYLSSAVQSVNVEPGVVVPLLRFQLKSAPGIRGEVRFAGGVKSEQASVKILSLAPGATPDLKILAQNMHSTIDWLYDGKYAFKDLVPGRYVVGVSREWMGRIVAHAVVDVGPEMVIQDLEVPVLEAAECLLVLVKDPHGGLVGDVTFQLEVRRENGSSSRDVTAEQQRDGSYMIPLDAFDDAVRLEDEYAGFDLAHEWPAGTKVRLTAQSERFGDKVVLLAPSTRNVEISFEVPATLLVTLGGYAGSGCEGRVTAVLVRRDDADEGDRPFPFGDDVVGADGTQKLGPVEPGAYSIQLWIHPPGADSFECTIVSTQPITLGPGENQASLSLPALYTLTVEVTEHEGESLSLHRDDDVGPQFGVSGSIDANGRATFDDLVAGDYSLYLDSAEGSGPMHVRVPMTGLVHFEPTSLNALAIWVSDEHGNLAQAGFKSGDVIVAVDGKAFREVAEMQASIVSLLAKKEITFTIVREGKRLELVVEGKTLASPFDLGGTFTPTSQ